jgi:RHS repeat-associated protein
MPDTQYAQRAKKVQMYYDPRGQVVRTVNPDATEQWVLFGRPQSITSVSLNELGLPVPSSPPSQGGVPAGGGGQGGATPWESYTYDANDLAPRTHPTNSGVPATHHHTPSSSLLDPLGRTIRTVDRNGTTQADEVVMKYEFDIRGNLLKVTDALERTAFTHVYDLKPKSGEEDQGANILRTTHIDSGTKTALFDAAHRPTELRDAKGALILHGYDELNRPTRIWARDVTAEDVTLRQELIYGDDTTDGPSTPTDTNHLGKLYQHYDEAGKVTLDEYDFKGNVLVKTREVISDAELLSVFDGSPECYRVDWGTSTDSILGTESFRTDTSFDALNRPKLITYPEDVNTDRKVATPTYNRAGALESVDFDGTDFVKHIAYNAKGQRLLIAFGNGVMTRYAYDGETFRLKRQRSETYSQVGWTFSSLGSVKQDTGYQYDLSGNIVTTTERTTNCGVGGSNALDRTFQYDALYRLLQATGRENAPTEPSIWDDRYRSVDHDTTTAYTQNYRYDKMGNILKLQHTGNSNFTRVFNPTGGGTAPTDYGTSSNLLNEIKIGGTTHSFTYDANGNLIQENASRFMQWDHADKMRCFYIDDGGTITKYAHYLYDSGGNRVKKLVRNDGGSYTSTTNIDGVYEYLTDGTAEQSLSHVMDDKSRIAMVFEGDMFGDPKPPIRYVIEDHLGNSVNEFGYDGSNIEKEEYYPFGETSFASYQKKRYKYNGKERDEESGLYNYGMRYYSAWTCRFIGVDPIYGEFAHYTPYQYAGNKPINAVDLDGLEEFNKTRLTFNGIPFYESTVRVAVGRRAIDNNGNRVDSGIFVNTIPVNDTNIIQTLAAPPNPSNYRAGVDYTAANVLPNVNTELSQAQQQWHRQNARPQGNGNVRGSSPQLQTIQIPFPAINFPLNSGTRADVQNAASTNPQIQNAIDLVAILLISSPSQTFTITGNTDASPITYTSTDRNFSFQPGDNTADGNIPLSFDRATSVAQEINSAVQRISGNPNANVLNRINVVGAGSSNASQPANAPAAQRAVDRNISVTVP